MRKSEEKQKFIESLDKEELISDYSTRSVPGLAEYYGVHKKWIIAALSYYGIKQHTHSEVQQLKSVRSKIKETSLKRYGVESYAQTDSFKSWYAENVDELKAKAVVTTKKNNLAKYGVESTNQLPEVKAKISKSVKEHWATNHDDRLSQMRMTCIDRYGVASYAQSDLFKNWYAEHAEEFKEKEIETKRNNFESMSKPEDSYYELLCEYYGQNNVIRQYKDARYPFYCDFYIKSEDLFIELNLHWTHGGHPFNSNNINDLKKLSDWQKKAKESDFYNTAIETWTNRDVKKLQVAKENNLNYKVYYSYNKNFHESESLELK